MMPGRHMETVVLVPIEGKIGLEDFKTMFSIMAERYRVDSQVGRTNIGLLVGEPMDNGIWIYG